MVKYGILVLSDFVDYITEDGYEDFYIAREGTTGDGATDLCFFGGGRKEMLDCAQRYFNRE